VPWGYKNPPALPPVFEPPGSFHPPVSRRSVVSLNGRQAPRLYEAGLLVGLPAIVLLLGYLVAVAAGFKLPAGPVAPWLIVEGVSIAAAAGLICWALAQGRQRRADGWRDYDGPSPFLVVAAFLALTTACELPVELALKALKLDVQSAPASLLLLLIYLASYFGLVQFLAVRTGALTWSDVANPQKLAPSADDWGGSEPARGWTRAWGVTISELRTRISGGRIGDILVGLAVVLPLIVATDLFSASVLLVLGLKPSDIAPDQFVSRDGVSILLTLITVAVVAPIGEEVFFRGFAANAWGRSLSHNSAILRSSLFFAFVHILNTATTSASVSWRVAIFNFAARVPVAFALTWLYMRRRSILASGTLHAGYNGLITVISFL
jgi:membrane protease YdiL (CAAX protease family)